MENLNSDNLMRQFTTVADAEEFSRLTSAKSTRCLSNNTHSNTDNSQSLDLQEIEELQAEVVDQERGKLRTKSKARKKLEHEKAVQRQ